MLTPNFQDFHCFVLLWTGSSSLFLLNDSTAYHTSQNAVSGQSRWISMGLNLWVIKNKWMCVLMMSIFPKRKMWLNWLRHVYYISNYLLYIQSRWTNLNTWIFESFVLSKTLSYLVLHICNWHANAKMRQQWSRQSDQMRLKNSFQLNIW